MHTHMHTHTHKHMHTRITSVQRAPDQSVVVEGTIIEGTIIEGTRVTSTSWSASVAPPPPFAVRFSLRPLLSLARLALMPSSLPARLPLLRTAKSELRMRNITTLLSSSLPRMPLVSSLPLPFLVHRYARTQNPIHTFAHAQPHAGTRRVAYLMGSLIMFVGLALTSIHLLSYTI